MYMYSGQLHGSTATTHELLRILATGREGRRGSGRAGSTAGLSVANTAATKGVHWHGSSDNPRAAAIRDYPVVYILGDEEGRGTLSLQRRRPEQGMGVALARDGDLYM
jgi:hypothetical protein